MWVKTLLEALQSLVVALNRHTQHLRLTYATSPLAQSDRKR